MCVCVLVVVVLSYFACLVCPDVNSVYSKIETLVLDCCKFLRCVIECLVSCTTTGINNAVGFHHQQSPLHSKNSIKILLLSPQRIKTNIFNYKLLQEIKTISKECLLLPSHKHLKQCEEELFPSELTIQDAETLPSI